MVKNLPVIEVLPYADGNEAYVGFAYQHFLETGRLLIPAQVFSAPTPILKPLLDRLPVYQNDITSCLSSSDIDSARLRVMQMASANDGPSAVMASPTGSGLDSATFFALASNRRLLTCTKLVEGLHSALRAGMRSVTVFGELRDFDLNFLSEAWRFSREHGLHLGFIPARSLRESQWWITKRLFAELLYSNHIGGVILARDSTADSFSDASFVISESRFRSADTSKLSAPYQFCLAEFHAKECCAKFNGHVFCGLKTDVALPIRTGQDSIPGCAEARGCVWQLHRIPFSDINSAHFIVISCGSLRLNNRLFGEEIGLGLNIFSAVPRSYLSPIRFVVSNEVLASVLGDLAMAGVSLGEITVAANELIRDTDCDEDCFVLLGDPEDKIDVSKALAIDPDVFENSFESDAQSAPSTSILPFHHIVSVENTVRSFVVSPTDPLKDQSTLKKIPKELLHFASSGGPELSSLSVLEILIRSDNQEGLWLSLKYGGAEHRLTGQHLAVYGVDLQVWCIRETIGRMVGIAW